MATIYIRDLALRGIIGIQDWEREKQQDLIINITVDYDATRAAETDDIAHAVDYKALKQKVIKLVESSRFNLVEKLAAEILRIAMEDVRVTAASVTIDKPHALRFARSVAVMMSSQRS
jgi:D-erythro-7,8-dihydroneopterin triphosphate epimerase